MYHKYLAWFVAGLFLIFQGCNASSTQSGSAVAGKVSVSLTDAPAYGYDHVWITVKDIWFHTSDSAEPGEAGWIKFPLSSFVTLDLLDLANGNISAPVWEDIELPEGDYTQIRIVLAKTEDALTDSASAVNLTYNNQVDVTGDTAAYPLRVPDAQRGIMLTGEFQVRSTGNLKLAIDFDAGHDVVKVERGAGTEYILKPRLTYFDLDNAGAIVGSIDTAAAADNPLARFVIKAEQTALNGQVHLVRRATAIADQTGKFILYPLAPGTYDLVIRGINYETVIVKGVPVVKGTTPVSSPTLVPGVTMTKAVAPDYAVNASIISPTGAWVNFLQTLPGTGEVPYDIRFSHFNPITGHIGNFPMSSDPIQVGTYDASSITLSTVSPIEGDGAYKAVAGAPLYALSDPILVTASTTTLSFGVLNVTPPATSRKVTGSIIVPQTFAAGFLDRGVLFACHGGMIVNAIHVDEQMVSGGTYTINLPGGSPDKPLPGAFYGIEAMGWLSSNPLNRAASIHGFANLSTTDAADVDMTMTMMP